MYFWICFKTWIILFYAGLLAKACLSRGQARRAEGELEGRASTGGPATLACPV